MIPNSVNYISVMKKIGLITFHAVHNCGAFLQAYALQRVLNSLIPGISCEILDFQSAAQKKCYSHFLPNVSVENILKNLWILLHPSESRQMSEAFLACQKTHLPVSAKKFTNGTELSQVVDEYAVFLSGSDQIWNVDLPDYSSAFYLDFVRGKPKIAYAASMGSNMDSVAFNSKREWIRQRLLDYDAISVREAAGRRFIHELIQKEVPVVLDPTMLLSTEDYSSLCGDRLVNDDYIYLYSVMPLSPEMIRLIVAFSKKVRLPVVVFSKTPNFCFWKNHFHVMHSVGPRDFLSLVRYARYVLSLSFHGCVFSMLYKKNFYSLQYGSGHEDQRLETLFENFGIQGRVLTPQMDVPEQLLPVDYSEMEPVLKRERGKSLDYLVSALG